MAATTDVVPQRSFWATRALFTGSVIYIAGSVPLHVYCSYIIEDVSLVAWFPMWFSYFLLIVVYPVFLTMFWKLQYKN